MTIKEIKRIEVMILVETGKITGGQELSVRRKSYDIHIVSMPFQCTKQLTICVDSGKDELVFSVVEPFIEEE